jgi:CubicO group peptidase (beta-lactamase class C family)
MKPLLVTLAAGILLGTALSPAPAKKYNFAPVNKFIDDSLKVFRDSVFMVVEKDGAPIFSASRGSFTLRTKKHIASASKWVSGAIMLRCEELGWLSFDDTLGKRLPLFSRCGKGKITLKQCFTMTSGLYGGYPFEAAPYFSLASSADSIARSTPLVHTPGAMWAYDGKGMQVAGRYAEVASGKSWRQLAKELVFVPCGMDSSDYDELPDNPWIAGGMRSTPADYLKFLRMIINDGRAGTKRVLTKRSIDKLFSAPDLDPPMIPQADPVWPVSHPDFPYGIDTVKYGFSSWMQAYNPSTAKVEEISSPGSYGTFPWADRKRNLIGIIFMDNGAFGLRAYYAEWSLVGLIRKVVDGKRMVPVHR